MTVAVPEPRTAAVTERDVVDGWTWMLPAVAELADQIAETDFVPKPLRGKTAAIAACILTGREMGIGPMLSLKVVHMVDGQPTLAAEYKRARALEAGHDIAYVETTTTRCVVKGRRRGAQDWATVTWTMDDAKRANLTGRTNWRNHPRRMLEARATGELCDLLFPECTYGLATAEEIEDGGTEGPGAVETSQPAPRTAQRRTRTPAAVPPATGADTPPADAPELAQPQAEQPPLPGEEPDETDYDSPGTASPEQLTALWATFTTDFDFTKDDKAQARSTVEQIIGRKLDGGTTANLSRNEASAAIDTLKRCGTKERLVALLATGEMPEDDDA